MAEAAVPETVDGVAVGPFGVGVLLSGEELVVGEAGVPACRCDDRGETYYREHYCFDT